MLVVLLLVQLLQLLAPLYLLEPQQLAELRLWSGTIESAATTTPGARSLQKHVGELCVGNVCVYVCCFAMSLAPPHRQPFSQL
jgi:hypothetical protein